MKFIDWKPEPEIVQEIVPDKDANKGGGLGHFLVPAILVLALALVCVLGWVLAKKKKKQTAPLMEESFCEPILDQEPTTAL